MQRIKFSEDIKPISDLRAKGAEIINQVKTTKRPILITQRGRGVAVLLEVSEFEKQQEKIAFMEAIVKGMEAAEKGELISHAEAMKKLGL
ncbi:Prevent-host-death protein [Candidatus Desulfofervidus auxilii]|uniref:Antitoxin n=1 Tax=Desulfofervidus auxilii TaxID=1621989 RepID=A0A7U4TI36_DESA2|nr:type II toxin-antitoxin system Phd/YefM family antitoxin [Candidatus Desulfofervidus auxilii]CAD7771103.1 Antitoxin Phd_YefM, type II toxin-antitoxin system [Candidatus Methanoperedenaceae archaeon GB50]CAD7772256.1 Antitoxin Phd_YefM, type II toxin-antitoxin system [Candidatus Methanoperedenaceae archaeon GB37]AMM40244.1 Prevent-host-death protein [Candidatus Desulfofervidus auxilii]AMM40818.1 Prevent-host-death protein [Candidatus Desulfofervidus auxilii]MDL1965520.1 type II toxin-antitox